MPTYKGKAISVAKARVFARKGIKLDPPKQASVSRPAAPQTQQPVARPTPAAPVLRRQPRPSAPPPEMHPTEAIMRGQTPRRPVASPPMPAGPSAFDLSDDELEKLTKPGR